MPIKTPSQPQTELSCAVDVTSLFSPSKKRKELPSENPEPFVQPVKGILRNAGLAKTHTNVVRFNFDEISFASKKENIETPVTKKQKCFSSQSSSPYQLVTIPTKAQPQMDDFESSFEHEVPSTPPHHSSPEELPRPTAPVFNVRKIPALPKEEEEEGENFQSDLTSKAEIMEWVSHMHETARANLRLKAELEAQMRYLASLVPKFQGLTKTTPAVHVEALITSNFEKVNSVLNEKLNDLELAMNCAVDTVPVFATQHPVESPETAALQATVDQLRKELDDSGSIIQFLSTKMEEMEKVVYKR